MEPLFNYHLLYKPDMTIKTVVIEDEQKSLHVLEDLIKQFASDLNVCGTAGHVETAIQEIETKSPDLVLMDVRIADGTSFDVLKRLSSRNFELIFVTAYDSYALEAIRFSAIDYLLKPVSIQEFLDAIERTRKKLSQKITHNNIDALLHTLVNQNSVSKKINIPTLAGYEFIDLADIIWCKSEGHYTTFFLSQTIKLTSSRNLGFYESLLGHYNFCRINHGIIINIDFIKTYMKGKGGYVIMKDGTELEISQRKKAEFLAKLGI